MSLKGAVIKLKFIFLIVPFFLSANKLVLQNIQEREFSPNSLVYILNANRKIIKFEKLRHFSLFNRKRIVSEAIYYENGTLHQKDISIDFKRAYFYEGNLYMHNCYATLKDGYIKSEDAIYQRTDIKFTKLVMKKKNKMYHKFKYIYHLK